MARLAVRGEQTEVVSAIRVATPEDAVVAGRILAAGFADDPLLSWVMSEPGRLAKLEALFTFAADATFIAHGVTYLTDDVASAWLPPPGSRPSENERALEIGTALVAAGCTNDDLTRLAIMGEAMEAAHPSAPHWYLGMIATLPDRRGRGIGSTMLEHALGPVDADRSPAYLESSNPRNITLYERHGFEVTGIIEIPGGPPMTAMWRPGR